MSWFLFFCLADDGIRYGHVTGVQTCALPIWTSETGAVSANLPRLHCCFLQYGRQHPCSAHLHCILCYDFRAGPGYRSRISSIESPPNFSSIALARTGAMTLSATTTALGRRSEEHTSEL